MRKFQVIIFYENDKKLEWYLSSFRNEIPIKQYIHKYDCEIYYEYEHFEIRCFKCFPSDRFRGYKCDMIAVEHSIYNSIDYNLIARPVTSGMLVPQRFDIGTQVF